MVALSGCVTAPTPREIAAADYGSPPTDHKSQIKNYFSKVLKDPESARYGEFTEPRKGYARVEGRALISPDGGAWLPTNVFGYEVSVQVNAKNSYGAYTGFERYLFLFRNGKIVHVMP
jgi:hypothetical protein